MGTTTPASFRSLKMALIPTIPLPLRYDSFLCDHACAPLGADSPATVAVADAVLAPQVREDVVVESVQQRVHVHQARDGLEEPMTGQRREASSWAGDPRPGPAHWGRGSAGQPGMGERRPRGPVNKAREGEAVRGRGRRERVRGAGAREAPPLTITIDAPRIMKLKKSEKWQMHEGLSDFC